MHNLSESVYKEYKERVSQYIYNRISRKDDVEVLCEEVFIKLFSFLDNYDSNRSAISTVIYKIAHDKVIDYYRTNKETEDLDENSAVLPASEDLVMDKIRAEEVRDALMSLSSELRDVIILRYYQGISLTEIATEWGIPYSLVISRQKAALKKLEKKLNQFKSI